MEENAGRYLYNLIFSMTIYYNENYSLFSLSSIIHFLVVLSPYLLPNKYYLMREISNKAFEVKIISGCILLHSSALVVTSHKVLITRLKGNCLVVYNYLREICAIITLL